MTSQNQDNSMETPVTPETTTTPSDTTAEQILKLEESVKEKEQKYLYLYAEFENFKKRTIKERSDLIKYGWESVARDLLDVVDNLDRALAYCPPTVDKNLKTGLDMVLEQFKSTLKKQGVESIDSIGKPFNPELHEALSQEASTEETGTILKEQVKGYTLHGRLLRPSRVIVSSGVSTTTH
jgi:molecular chaperone GrpE